MAFTSSRLVSTKQTRFHHFTLKWPQLSREALVLRRSAAEITASVTQRTAPLLCCLGGGVAAHGGASAPDQQTSHQVSRCFSPLLEAVLTQVLLLVFTRRAVIASRQTPPPPPPPEGGKANDSPAATPPDPHPPQRESYCSNMNEALLT